MFGFFDLFVYNNNMKKKNSRFILSTIILSLSIVVFLVIAMLVISKYRFNIDYFNVVVANHRTAFWTGFFKIFTYLGEFYFLVIVVLIMLIVLKQKHIGLSTLFGLALASIINVVIKYIVRRPRPSDLMIIDEIGFSFPSAHAMLSLLIFGMIIYFVCTRLKNLPLKVVISSVLVILILAIGFSRIYLGVHYLSDVIAGCCIGLAVTIVSISIFNLLMTIKKSKIDIN